MCFSGASVAGRGFEGGLERRQDARATAGFDGRDAGLDALDVVGRVQLRRRHDPLERRVEGDHAERVLGLQQAGGFDGGLARHRHLGRAAVSPDAAAADDVHAARAVDDQEQRQAALLRLDRRLGRDRQQVVEHACPRSRLAKTCARRRSPPVRGPRSWTYDCSVRCWSRLRLVAGVLTSTTPSNSFRSWALGGTLEAGRRSTCRPWLVSSATRRVGRRRARSSSTSTCPPVWRRRPTVSVLVRAPDAAARRGPGTKPGAAIVRGQAELRFAGLEVDRTVGDHASDRHADAAGRRRPALPAGRAGRRCGRPHARWSERSSAWMTASGCCAAGRRVAVGRTTRPRRLGSASSGGAELGGLPAVGQQDDLGGEGAVTLDDAAGQVERGSQVRAAAGRGLRRAGELGARVPNSITCRVAARRQRGAGALDPAPSPGCWSTPTLSEVRWRRRLLGRAPQDATSARPGRGRPAWPGSGA